MLDGMEAIFSEKDSMMAKLKRESYEKNMMTFRGKYGHYFREMVEFVGQSQDKELAAREIGDEFTGNVEKAFKNPKKGKIKPYIQADLNYFMIYYVFPAILMTGHRDAKVVADSICKSWNGRFADSNIQYADYDTLCKGFRNKIFGIF